MNPPASSLSVRPSPSVPPHPSSSSSSSSTLMDKFLGLSLSPASVHSLSSDTTDANDLDELDEQDIWDVENEIDKVPPSAPLAPLPPRVHTSRRSLGTPESRSPLRDVAALSFSSLASPSINSVGSVAGMIQGLSSASSSNGGSRSPVGRVWAGEVMARRATTSASRMIPRMAPPASPPHHQTDAGDRPGAAARIMPQSAPLNIPDWSKLHGRKQKVARDWMWKGNKEMAGEDSNAEEERLPPHELLAREYAKSERATSSVLEGAGRTLKGRDLSRVRNAVLTYTGFVE